MARLLVAAVGAALFAGAVAAQPGAVAPPPPRTLFATRGQSPPPAAPALPQPNELVPGSPPLPDAPPPGVTLTDPSLVEPPLPGSLEDDYHKELAARQGLRTATWQGTAITAFPNTLLWEPPLAVKKDPRMQLLITDQANYRSGYTVDTAIGGSMGFYQFDFQGADLSAQLGAFAVVQTRLTPDDLVAADYRFGFPVTFKWGWWHAKVAYEHTSTHLGDEFIEEFQPGNIPAFAKDEAVIGLGRMVTENLRVYGHFGYAFSFQVPGVEDTSSTRTRYDVGAEWYQRCATGFWGTPFAAVNFEWRGDQEYDTNTTLQAGWLWRNPYARVSAFRIFVEHYTGRSPFGQFQQTRERFTSFGLGFEY